MIIPSKLGIIDTKKRSITETVDIDKAEAERKAN